MEGNMSNIQEKAEQYAHELHKSSIDFNGSYNIAKNAYVAGYNEAKRWIPVGERLPCDLLDIYTCELTGRKETPLVLARIEDELVIAQMAKCKDDNHYKWVIGYKIIGRKITEWREI